MTRGSACGARRCRRRRRAVLEISATAIIVYIGCGYEGGLCRGSDVHVPGGAAQGAHALLVLGAQPCHDAVCRQPGGWEAEGGRGERWRVAQRRRGQWAETLTHVKGVLALANDGWAVLAWQLAGRAAALICKAADTASVLRVLGHAPPPGGHKASTKDADLDGGDLSLGHN
jgi:hypothetical protein